MKRTVLSMADENFDFSVHEGEISFSCERIEYVFTDDEVRSGSFSVLCKSDSPMLGVCQVNNPRMTVKNPQFHGFEAEIEFEFDSKGMEPDDVSKGEFILLTDKGEYTLPFVCVREATFINSTLGHIKNLFHFANLAHSNWNEAVNVFYSNDFTSILSGKDAIYKGLYRGLSENVLNERNVDEFLVAIKKKDRVTYTINSEEIRVVNPKSEVSKTITVTKNTWGFASVDVKSDATFIFVPCNHFAADDFEGDRANIEVKIIPEFLNPGRNYGKVTIITPDEVVDVVVKVDKDFTNVTTHENFMFKKSFDKLLRLYIEFSFDRLSQDEWCKKSLEIAKELEGRKEHAILGALFKTQIYIISGKVNEAGWLLKQIDEVIENEKLTTETYGYYLYVKSLVSKDAEMVNTALRKIKKYYAKGMGNSIYAWLILYLTEDFYTRSDKKKEFLIEQFRFGNNSPLLYIEGLNLLNTNPSMLMKLDEYEEAVLRFGLKHKAISASLGERIQFFVSREKEFKQIWYEILKYQYAYMPSKELLNTIVSYLCKGNKVGNEYFEWYQKGVEAELRLTRLYEFYMDSLPLDYDGDLPQMVMMYFAYQNDLDYRKKAYLYHNVLTRKKKYPEIALSYRETLESFAREQIKLKHINEDLLFAYAKVLNPDFIDEDIANECVTMQFIRRVSVPEGVRRVVLIHDKIIGEQKFSPENGFVYCPIYSRDFRLFYEDFNGNRMVVPEEKISGAILNNPMLLEKVAHLVKDKIGLIMCRVESMYTYDNINDDNVFDYERLLHSDIITYTYKKEIIKNLLNFYFENDYINELEDILQNVKPEIFEGPEKGRFLQILIARGMYDSAFNVLTNFGPEHIEIKSILRLVSRLLVRTDFEENDALVSYAQYAYREGKYDENILAYLEQHFKGSTSELRRLYKDCEAFGLDTFMLLENIIILLLFTNAYCADKLKYLDTYIEMQGSGGLERAFIAQCSYDYFVKETVTDDYIFMRAQKLIEDGEKVNRITKLALLKYYSLEENEDRNEKIIDALVNEELDRRVCFPFFMSFQSIVRNLQSFTDYSFVEYRGNPNSRVVIHYCIEHDDGGATEYKKEEMNHLYSGIFVKSFILFCGETVQYYITEESGNMEQLTESSVLTKTESDNDALPWRYTALNDLFVAKHLSDYVTVEEDLVSYMEKDFLTKKLFKTI
ncbi:MAG: hypothetical protein II717_01185 [Lachnospiraceae bacterium]|nr:hypothetical protein [Lachnospiraceae bacterium]